MRRSSSSQHIFRHGIIRCCVYIGIALVLIGIIKHGLIQQWMDARREQFKTILSSVNKAGQLYYKENGKWNAIDARSLNRYIWRPEHVFLTNAVRYTELENGLRTGELLLHREANPTLIKLFFLDIDPAYFTFKVLFRDAPQFVLLSARQHTLTHNALAAINANFFSDTGPLGMIVSEGRIIQPYDSTYRGSFIVLQATDMPALIINRNYNPAGITEGFQSYPSIVKNGKIPYYLKQQTGWLALDAITRRSAIASLHNGHFLWLVTDTSANGLNFSELTLVLVGLGAKNALGLDGGGSTQLFINHPQLQKNIHGFDPVPVCLGLFRR